VIAAPPSVLLEWGCGVTGMGAGLTNKFNKSFSEGGGELGEELGGL
jgi:hypothetical protein